MCMDYLESNIFKKTKIYTYLSDKQSEFLGVINSCLNKVTPMLDALPGLYTNYTFHDLNHAYRVCRYMEIISFDNKTENLSINDFDDCELTIMLLSALLHDIGMFYDSSVLAAIKEGTMEHLDEFALNYDGVFSKYKDDQEVIKECVRSCHHLRSRDFIISHLKDVFNDFPSNFVDIIANLCQSHCEDHDFIKGLPIQKRVGSYEINVRYISLLLRLGDALDADHSRVPVFWFINNKIEGFSKKEWEKQLSISNSLEGRFSIDTDNKMEVLFDGSSGSPESYRSFASYINNWVYPEMVFAIEESANWNNKYRIQLSRKINNSIDTIGFEASDLRLNLDYCAITNLLMGENIYGSNKYGLRELIQNSIDGCLTKKEFYKKNNVMSPYVPKILITIDSKNNHFVIEDNGSGMSSEIIRNNFLNIGKSYYMSDSYKKMALNYSPIGKFGIGFLACYLLSNTILLKTRHMKEGITRVFELEKDSNYVVVRDSSNEEMVESGTKIVLCLNEVLEVFKNADIILDFIKTQFYLGDDIILEFDNDGIRNQIQTKIVKDEEIINTQKKFNNTSKENDKVKIISGTNSIFDYKILIEEKDNEVLPITKPSSIYLYDEKANYFKEVESSVLNSAEYLAIKVPEKNFKNGNRKFKKDIAKGKYILLLIEQSESIFGSNFFDDLAKILKKDKNLNVPTFLLNDDILDKIFNVFFCDGNFFETYVSNTRRQGLPNNNLFKKGVLLSASNFINFQSLAKVDIVSYIINVKSDEINLDVSRSKIISGIKLINKELSSIFIDLISKNNQKYKNCIERFTKSNLLIIDRGTRRIIQ